MIKEFVYIVCGMKPEVDNIILIGEEGLKFVKSYNAKLTGKCLERSGKEK